MAAAQLDVEEQELGLAAFHRGGRFSQRLGFADDVDVLLLEQAAQSRAVDLMVVD